MKLCAQKFHKLNMEKEKVWTSIEVDCKQKQRTVQPRYNEGNNRQQCYQDDLINTTTDNLFLLAALPLPTLFPNAAWQGVCYNSPFSWPIFFYQVNDFVIFLQIIKRKSKN